MGVCLAKANFIDLDLDSHVYRIHFLVGASGAVVKGNEIHIWGEEGKALKFKELPLEAQREIIRFLLAFAKGEPQETYKSVEVGDRDEVHE